MALMLTRTRVLRSALQKTAPLAALQKTTPVLNTFALHPDDPRNVETKNYVGDDQTMVQKVFNAGMTTCCTHAHIHPNSGKQQRVQRSDVGDDEAAAFQGLCLRCFALAPHLWSCVLRRRDDAHHVLPLRLGSFRYCAACCACVCLVICASFLLTSSEFHLISVTQQASRPYHCEWHSVQQDGSHVQDVLRPDAVPEVDYFHGMWLSFHAVYTTHHTHRARARTEEVTTTTATLSSGGAI